MSLILSCHISSAAFVGDGATETTEHYIVNDETFDISFSQDGSIRTAVINEGEKITILQIDEETDIMTYNGVPVREEVIRTKVMRERNSILSAKSNWTEPTESVTSLSFVSYSVAAIVGYLQLKYSIMPEKASYIAGLIIGAGGFLYVKSVSQYNYVDYAPKVGYKLTESLHLTEEADDKSLFKRTMTGRR